MTSIVPGAIEVSELFDLMESNQPSVVQDIKNLIQENFNTTKESWLVSGLYDYYIQTHSNRCLEILTSVSREPHDRFLIDKINEGFRSNQNRKQSLIFFGHLVRRQPSWLYKIASLGLMSQLIKILKSDTDMVILLTGLLSITAALPTIPTYIIPFINDIFDVFGRLAVWGHSSHNIPEEHVLHLQVGLYSLFHRLYAMYPCNFLSYLRHNFSSTDKRVVFLHAVKPMLETVKMHPLLVTASKEGELAPNRWRNKEYHDVIAECALISLDVLESGLPEEINSINLKPRLSTSVSIDFTSTPIQIPGQPEVQSGNMPANQLSSLIQQSIKVETDDLTSLVTMMDESAPPTPLTTGSTQPTTTVLTSSNTNNIKTSPPEAAMEATPENTPVATPVKDRERVHFKLPPPGSPAVAHLAFGKAQSSSRVPQTPPATPANSTPSSPAPQTGENTQHATGTLHRRDSIFDSMRRDSVMYQRLQKVMIDQQSSLKDEMKRPSPISLGDAVVTLEPIPGSLPDTGPLTPMLGATLVDAMSEDDTEEHVCSTACPDGGVAMPDRRSLLAFAKRVSRLRYYSHCSDQHSEAPSPGSSPSTQFTAARKLKRSTSCPNIFKKPITEELGDSDSTDGISSSSQTKERPEPITEEFEKEKIQPYELFFDGVLPQFMQCPGQNQSHIQSPHHLLDLCLTKAASLHGKCTEDVHVLRVQIELLHSQLLFERHRRESHALRNRSLAKKCRNIQHKDELNYALRSQLHSLEKEVAILKKEVLIQRGMSQAKEKDLQQVISDLEMRADNYRREISALHEARIALDTKFTKINSEYQMLLKESDQRRADIFQLENDNKHCRKYVEINSELKTAYETAQKEILLLGELCRRQKDIMSTYQPHRHILREMEDLRNCCEQEINDLKNILETKASQTEAALGFVKNLESQLAKKDVVILEQKKIIQEVGLECDDHIKALSEKYEAVKDTNHRLELEILNLQHQLATKTYAAKGNNARRISPSNGESCRSHNSNGSDVDSAASAGGMQLSPEERSVFIFGSPQFDPPPTEMNDLQVVIDKENPNPDAPHP